MAFGCLRRMWMKLSPDNKPYAKINLHMSVKKMTWNANKPSNYIIPTY